MRVCFVRLVALVAAAAVVFVLPACSSNVEQAPRAEENVATTSDALTIDDAVARADSWANAKLKYCQAPNGGRDYDAACSTYCSRQSNAQWDPYRSDCSGLVSWAWGLPAPGRVTGQFAPFQNDITHAIPATDLRAGDAVNNSSHVMLFKAWVTHGSRATFIEEPGCSSAMPYAHETTSDVSLSGDSIYVTAHGASFTAIRYDGLTLPPPPNAPPKGAFDAAKCDAIAGWAQDPDAPAAPLLVDLTFDAAQGKSGGSGSMQIKANVSRADLCTAIKSCNHAFTAPVPRGLADGKAHTVYAYASDDTNGASTDLGSKTFTCAPPAIPVPAASGIKRWVASQKVLAAWKMDMLMDVAREPKAEVDAYPRGPDMPAAPIAVVSDDGAPEVWVVDGSVRRHVVDAASLSAWQLAVAKWPAAKVHALTEGQPWPKAPFVFMGEGAPEVWVLDAVAGAPPPVPGPGNSSEPPGGGGAGGGAGAGSQGGDASSSAGCAMASHASHGTTSRGMPAGATLIALGLIVATLRRRGA